MGFLGERGVWDERVVGGEMGVGDEMVHRSVPQSSSSFNQSVHIIPE